MWNWVEDIFTLLFFINLSLNILSQYKPTIEVFVEQNGTATENTVTGFIELLIKILDSWNPFAIFVKK